MEFTERICKFVKREIWNIFGQAGIYACVARPSAHRALKGFRTYTHTYTLVLGLLSQTPLLHTGAITGTTNTRAQKRKAAIAM